ncbi:Nucleosomal histone H3-Lys79 methylase [Marasmius tenuissimus]|uniref:Histone-lysine N-methyltransferase, H3 lysine-79 specific n=1 Tax=Marasmius tenuissimus TaxID=585030 RepID=A0ABR2ZQ94_9AGAR
MYMTKRRGQLYQELQRKGVKKQFVRKTSPSSNQRGILWLQVWVANYRANLHPTPSISSSISSRSGKLARTKDRANTRPAFYKFRAPKLQHTGSALVDIPELQYQTIATSSYIVPITHQLTKYRYVIPEEQMRTSFGIVTANHDQFDPAFREDVKYYPFRTTAVYVLLPGLSTHQPFIVVKPKKGNRTNYNPIKDLYATIRSSFTLVPPFNEDTDFLVRLDRALKAGKRREFLAIIGEINQIFSNTDASKSSSEVVDNVVEQVYGKCVSPCLRTVSRYTSFSKEVYGEFRPPFIREILEKVVTITADSVVLDLGCGVGQVVIQIVLSKLCSGYGIELREDLTEIAQDVLEQALLHAQLWGITPGSMKVYSGDCTEDHRVPNLLQISDLVIVNNHLFPPDLNEDIARLLVKHMKSSCVVVTKAPFSEKRTTRSGCRLGRYGVEGLSVEKREHGPDMLSWDPSRGLYYVYRRA